MIFLLLACTATSPSESVAETGEPIDDGQRPVVASVDDVACAEQQSAGELWTFAVTATDPQGPDTVGEGVVYARDSGGTQLAEYPFPCDDTGVCISSFRASYDNLPCSLGGELVLGFVVTDQDGHPSAELRHVTE